MKVLNLRCAHDHRFEGWFSSDEDFATQGDRGLVACPLCGDLDVQRLPSAPRLNLSGGRESDVAVPTVADTVQQKWMQAVRHMMAHTEDVGERFPEEARRIHYGETQERGIRGRASRDEAQALAEEGIEVMALPVPAALKEPLQ